MKNKTIFHIILSALIFLIVDRGIRFVGTYNTNKYEIEHTRIRIELTLTSILAIFIFITLQAKGMEPMKF
jgi:Trk-type K+ transport system membrane component